MGRGNYYPGRYDCVDYRMVYVDIPSFSEEPDDDGQVLSLSDQYDEWWENLTQEIAYALPSSFVAPKKRTWINHDCMLIAENDLLQTWLYDNEAYVALVMAVKNNEYHPSYQNLGLKQFDPAADKLFDKLIGYGYRLKIPVGGWIVSPYKKEQPVLA